MQPMVNIALNAARKAGEKIAKASDRIDLLTVEEKGINDFVTDVDRQAEKEIIYHLHKAYPEHNIVGEETGEVPGSAGNSDYTWIIDPLDGTTNFIHGIPHFAVSIACLFKGKLEHAVIVDPIRREEFTASRGYGAQLNGHRIRVSKKRSVEGALLGTGIPFRGHQMEHMDNYTKALNILAKQTAGIRRAGAASLDLAYVAAGRLDGFWEIGLNQWDIAAGALLVQEAGGLVTDLNGGHQFMESGNIACGNAKCLKGILQTVQPLLGNVR